jgi:hypothetical protein
MAFPLVFAGANVLNSIYNNLSSGSELKRIQEEYVKEQERKNRQLQEKAGFRDLHTEGARRIARKDIERGIASATGQAANVGAGAGAASGLGGDINSAQIGAAKAAAPIASATAPLFGQLAQTEAQFDAAKAANLAQQSDLNYKGAQIGDMVMYHNQDKAKPFADITNSFFSGLAGGKQLWDMLSLEGNVTTEETNKSTSIPGIHENAGSVPTTPGNDLEWLENRYFGGGMDGGINGSENGNMPPPPGTQPPGTQPPGTQPPGTPPLLQEDQKLQWMTDRYLNPNSEFQGTRMEGAKQFYTPPPMNTLPTPNFGKIEGTVEESPMLGMPNENSGLMKMLLEGKLNYGDVMKQSKKKMVNNPQDYMFKQWLNANKYMLNP